MLHNGRVLTPEHELAWLRRVRDQAHRLAAERDPERVVPQILDGAIELAGAERGYLVRVLGAKPEGGYRFRVELARGFDQASLEGRAADVSRTAVRRVVERGQALLTSDQGDQDVLDASSVQERRVLSIACVPMRLRGATLGVLYLDHRHAHRAFTQEELPLLQTFADQAALALDALAAAPHPAAPTALALVGHGARRDALARDVARAARTRDPALVTGEAGAGRDGVARAIHAQSADAAAGLEVIACDGLEPDALEALLGPGERRPGTVVLSGVEALPQRSQARLLRTLKERRYAAGRPSGPRVVATAEAALRERVEQGAFRSDLYYCLDVLRVPVPSLRERPEDLELLIAHLTERAGGEPLTFSPAAAERLRAYSWPGNLRELENEVRRLAAHAGRQISSLQLSAEVREGRGVPRASGALGGKTLGDVTRAMVEAAIRDSGGNKSRAARQLGVPRTTLYHLLDRYGLS